MVEQLKQLSFIMDLLTGQMDNTQIANGLLATEGKTPKDLEDLDEDDKKDFEDTVLTMRGVSDIFDKLVTSQAKVVKKYYDALLSVGFTNAEALTLAAAGKGAALGDFKSGS
jgi:hypothetical protein